MRGGTVTLGTFLLLGSVAGAGGTAVAAGLEGASASTAAPTAGAPAMEREEGAACEVNVV